MAAYKPAWQIKNVIRTFTILFFPYLFGWSFLLNKKFTIWARMLVGMWITFACFFFWHNYDEETYTLIFTLSGFACLFELFKYLYAHHARKTARASPASSITWMTQDAKVSKESIALQKKVVLREYGDFFLAIGVLFLPYIFAGFVICNKRYRIIWHLVAFGWLIIACIPVWKDLWILAASVLCLLLAVGFRIRRISLYKKQDNLEKQTPLTAVNPQRTVLEPSEQAYAAIFVDLQEATSPHKAAQANTDHSKPRRIRIPVIIDTGELVLTDKRIIFTGHARSFEISYAQLMRVDYHEMEMRLSCSDKNYTILTRTSPDLGKIKETLAWLLSDDNAGTDL